MQKTETKRKVAYLMSRFPAVTETFILYEMLELERRGLGVEIFPLLYHHEPVLHPGAEPLVARAHYEPHVSWAMVWAQFVWLWIHPFVYLRVWADVLWGNRHSLGFWLRALLVVPKAALFARKMQALGITHLHAHWATHPTLAAYVISRLTGLPYSFTCHAHDLYVDQTMLEVKVRAASKVVTISEFNRRLLAQWFGKDVEEKTVVVRCGIDADIFRPRQRTEVSEVPTLLCVASFREYKGHRYLLEALARLRDEGLRFRCLLVGDGEDRPSIEAQRRALRLEDAVELCGKLARTQVSELTASADLLVMPSVVARDGQMEGIPVAVMEALACATPVVATAISGIPELVEDGHTGLLVPEKNVSALAAAIRRLAQDGGLRRQLGENGRRKVLEQFNLVRNAERLYELLAGSLAPRLGENTGKVRNQDADVAAVMGTALESSGALATAVPEKAVASPAGRLEPAGTLEREVSELRP